MTASSVSPRKRIPVSVIGGFLGAGKTTLVNHLIGSGGYRFGVIVNEFGETGIDGSLIENLDEDGVAELENGCLCCAARDDLLGAMVKLALRATPPDYLLIELSGVADPVPVAQTVLDPYVKGLFELDGIIGVADAQHLRQTVEECPEGSVQLAYASAIVLNKSDLASDGERLEARALAQRLNPLAELHESQHSRVSPETLIAQHAFSTTWEADGHHHHHTPGMTSFTLRSEVPLNRRAWNAFVETFISARPAQVYRTKGFLSMKGLPTPFIFQSVRDVIDLSLAQGHEHGPSVLVVIGRDLDEDAYQRAFSQTYAQPLKRWFARRS